MQVEKKFVLCGFAYAVLGMGFGVYMGASHDHSQHVTHAHVLLVGFVVSLIYAVTHRLWLADANTMLAAVQFWVHQVAALVMFICLFVLFGGIAAEPTVGPVLGLSSIGVMLGAVLMFFMLAKACCKKN